MTAPVAFSADTPRRMPRLPLLVCAFAIVCVATAVRTYENLNVPGHPRLPFYGMQDFRDQIYYPVVAFLDGVNPYDSAAYVHRYPVAYAFGTHSPGLLALYAPFGLLPLPVAESAAFALNLVLVLTLAGVALRACGIPPRAAEVLAVGTGLLLTRAGHSTLYLGQGALVYILGTYLALMYGRTRPWLGGVGLALALLKPTFGIPLALLMLVRREYRAAVWGAAASAVAALAVVAVLAGGPGGVPRVLTSIVRNALAFLSDPVNSGPTGFRVDAVGLAERWFTTVRIGPLVTAAVLVVGAAAVRRSAAARDAAPYLTWTIVLLTVLLCGYHQGYDMLLLAIPIVALGTSRWRPSLAPLGPATAALLFGLLLLPMVNPFASFKFIAAVAPPPAVRLAVQSMNAVMLSCALILCTMLALRRVADPGA